MKRLASAWHTSLLLLKPLCQKGSRSFCVYFVRNGGPSAVVVLVHAFIRSNFRCVFGFTEFEAVSVRVFKDVRYAVT